MRVFFIPAVLTFAAPLALAQSATPSTDPLTKGVVCAAPVLKAVSDSAPAGPNQTSVDQSTCQASAPAASTTDLAPTSSGPSAAVAAALAEAQRNLENLKFEVGPPPRNMTKGRTSGS